MNKKVVRLNEGQLKAVIKESVRKILKESYGETNDVEDQLYNYYEPEVGFCYADYLTRGEDYANAPKEVQNKHSWGVYDALAKEQDKERRALLDKEFEYYGPDGVRPYQKIEKAEYLHPSEWERERERKDDFKKKLDKQWKDTKDIEKYTKQANSRPLHRKGSLNRV